ncbi:MAG: methyltransferase [Alphaproteobacteria bacterium]|nr:MAG: methyltransferase [Alphaproteobacteria bacterium]
MSDTAGGQATRWTERDTETFIDLGRYYVPERDRQIATVCDAVPPPAGPARFVELCCGEGLLARALLARFPTATLLALDGSEAMLAATAGKLAAEAGRFETRLFDLPSADWRRFPEPVHAVVSSLAIHHLSADEKRRLYADMAGCLAPGGALVVCDLVEALTPEGRALYAAAWDEAVRRTALERDGDLAAFDRFRADDWNFYAMRAPDPIDKPDPLFDQLKWFEDAGLETIEVHWLVAGHAIFSGRKPRD